MGQTKRGSIYRDGRKFRGRVQVNGKQKSFHAATRQEVQDKIDAFIADHRPTDTAHPVETDEHTSDAWRLTRKTNKRVKTKDDLVRECDIDLQEWDIKKWGCRKWEVGTKHPKTGKVTITPLFLVYADLIPKPQVVFARNEIEDLKRRAKKAMPRPRIPKLRKGGSVLFEVSPNDQHLGKLCWAAETGWEDSDSKIQLRDFEDGIEGVLQRGSGFDIGKILFVVGNDLLHIDNRSGTTESGTIMDRDSRYHKVFRLARAAVRERIDRMVQLAPVHVVVVPGNHDQHSAWHLGDSLDVAFEKHRYVTVDCAPTARKYTEWGRCMLMHSHGHKTKKQGEQLPQIMAAEQPDMWSRTRYREAHQGHVHGRHSRELFGVMVRWLPSMSATDAYHADEGYVGNLRCTESFVWDKQDGLIGTAQYNLKPN